MGSFFRYLLLVGGFVFLLGSLSGCGETPSPAVQKPAWVLNPAMGGKTGAVGVAGRTYDQKVSTQRKLAIGRALDELALQQGVKVELKMDKEEHATKDTSSVAMNSTSSYQTNSASAITAHIEKVWQDPYTKELYIWLVLDK